MAAANAPMPLPPHTPAKGDLYPATSGRLNPGLAATGPGLFGSASEGSPHGTQALGSASGQLQAASSLDYGVVGAQLQTHLRPHHNFPKQQGMPVATSPPAGTPAQHGTQPLSMQLSGSKPIAAALVNTHAPGLSLGPITAGWDVRTASTSTAASALATAAEAEQAAAAMAALTLAHGAKPLGADVAEAVPGAGAGGAPDSAEAGGLEAAGSDAALAQHQLGDAAAQATQRQAEGAAMEQLGGQSQKQGAQAVAGAGSQGQSNADPSNAALNAIAQAQADACAEADSSSNQVVQQVQRGHHVKAMGAGTAGVDSGSDGEQAQSTLFLCDQSSSSSRHGSPSSSSLGADSGGEGEGEGEGSNGRDGSGGSSGSPSRLVNHHHHRSSESSAAAAGAEAPSSDESPAEEEGEGKPSRHLWLGNIPLRPNKAAMELLFR